MAKERIVGIRFDEKEIKGAPTANKTYYYKTSGDYQVGQEIRVRAPNGGFPKAIIVENDSKKKIKHIKTLQTRKD